MKKSLTIIGKLLLKAAMFLAGSLAFMYVIGEPTEEWLAWVQKTFGVFAGVWCLVEKVLASLLIYGLYRLDRKVGPVIPDGVVSRKATEGR